MAPSVLFCCRSPSASKFYVLCVQGCSSANLDSNEWLFELLQSGRSPLTSSINKAFLPKELLTGYFLFSPLLCVKIPVDQQFLKYSDPPSATHSKSLDSPVFPILMLSLKFSTLS